jgi:hypothetical protein
VGRAGAAFRRSAMLLLVGCMNTLYSTICRCKFRACMNLKKHMFFLDILTEATIKEQILYIDKLEDGRRKSNPILNAVLLLCIDKQSVISTSDTPKGVASRSRVGKALCFFLTILRH